MGQDSRLDQILYKVEALKRELWSLPVVVLGADITIRDVKPQMRYLRDGLEELSTIEPEVYTKEEANDAERQDRARINLLISSAKEMGRRSSSQNRSMTPQDVSMDNERTQSAKERRGRFRILIIGRVNSGKTMILKRVCDTAEEPEVYNMHGHKVDRSILAASAERGEHDIENEMVFASNPDFCFHDSRGFQSGGSAELDRVKAFIAHRSQQQKSENRLHAIWYVI